MYKTAAIFLLLFLLSCTVTRRVHRPGFHLEWKKKYKVQKDEKSVADISIPIDIHNGNDDRGSSGVERHYEKISNPNAEVIEARGTKNSGLREPQPAVSEQNLIAESLETIAPRPLNEVHQKSKKSLSLLQQITSSLFEKSGKYDPLPIAQRKKVVSKQSNTLAGDGFLYVGYITLGLGAYLFIGALFSYLGFWILENLFYSLVFSGNGIIAGILGFILFLIILLFVFIAYAIVHYVLGGAYLASIISMALLGVGLLFLLIGASL
ncbi:MAG: hypothetical protein ACFHU9_14280 [Fluviicola sp.]